MSGTVRYLCAGDIAALAPDPALAREAVARAFRAYHAGEAVSRPKLAIDAGPGHAFQSLVAASATLGRAANKWLGMAPAAGGRGEAGIDALIALNDFAAGRLLALLDGHLITGIRTAAMSAVAAHALARRDSATIGFVGCGLQAAAHLDAMASLLPGLTTVLALGRTRESARQLAARAAARGFAAELTDDAEALVGRSDIVVTSVPMRPGFAPFLDPGWIRPGAFVAAVDVARSWHPQALRSLDILATDDHLQQADHPIAPGLGPKGTFDADLSELAAGKTGRSGADQRAMFIFRGFALADLALAALVLDLAEERGIGTLLPR